MIEATHTVHWTRWINGKNRKGDPCSILVKGEGVVRVQFEDGTMATVDRRAIRAMAGQHVNK